jgi:hypothetical protein
MESKILYLLKSIESLVEKSIHTTMTEEKATDIYAITNELMCLLIGNKNESKEIELKTKSLHEIIQKCKSMGIDPKDAKITSKIIEDLRYPDEFYVKLFLNYKK